MIHEILESDRKVHRKQRHTAQRIFDRLRDEHDYTGGATIVKGAVREWKESHREVFLPLSHPPGEAQFDYGLADVVLNGETVKVALFVMTLPYTETVVMRMVTPKRKTLRALDRNPAGQRPGVWVTRTLLESINRRLSGRRIAVKLKSGSQSS